MLYPAWLHLELMLVALFEIQLVVVRLIMLIPSACCVSFNVVFGNRYVEYIWQMAADVPFIPHHQPVLISSISLSPVPLFNRMR